MHNNSQMNKIHSMIEDIRFSGHNSIYLHHMQVLHV